MHRPGAPARDRYVPSCAAPGLAFHATVGGPSSFGSFTCLNCDALYQLVKAECSAPCDGIVLRTIRSGPELRLGVSVARHVALLPEWNATAAPKTPGAPSVASPA